MYGTRRHLLQAKRFELPGPVQKMYTCIMDFHKTTLGPVDSRVHFLYTPCTKNVHPYETGRFWTIYSLGVLAAGWCWHGLSWTSLPSSLARVIEVGSGGLHA